MYYILPGCTPLVNWTFLRVLNRGPTDQIPARRPTLLPFDPSTGSGCDELRVRRAQGATGSGCDELKVLAILSLSKEAVTPFARLCSGLFVLHGQEAPRGFPPPTSRG